MSLAKTIDYEISESDYLEGECISELRHEYIDGFVYAMAGASRKHNLISSNISRELGNKLKQKKSPCEIYSSDMKVKVNEFIKGFFYPDVMVACDINDDYYQNSPVIIIEVLSNSTRKKDKTTKKQAYFSILTLQEYVLISQEFCEIEVFYRVEHQPNKWQSTLYFIGDEIHFKSLDLSISVEDIYYQINNEDNNRYLKAKEKEAEEKEEKEEDL